MKWYADRILSCFVANRRLMTRLDRTTIAPTSELSENFHATLAHSALRT